jgi:serine/threonine-protein kinase
MPLENLGPYKLEKLLGRGGMGAVYAGVNNETGERAAVKLLSGHLADDPGFRERFKQEIETLKRLLHPNIVQLFGFGEEDGNLFYVMELIDGRSLQDELATGRRFSWREVARIGVAVARALKHAHDRGIIHRDLKPENVMFTRIGEAKVLDFGVALFLNSETAPATRSLTETGSMVGTLPYMAPEVLRGERAERRSDLYSLGVLAYEMATGRRPFPNDEPHELMYTILNQSPPEPHILNGRISGRLEAIILRLLAKKSEERFGSAAELLAALHTVGSTIPIGTAGVAEAASGEGSVV